MKPDAPVNRGYTYQCDILQKEPIPTNVIFYKRDTYLYHVIPRLLTNYYLCDTLQI